MICTLSSVDPDLQRSGTKLTCVTNCSELKMAEEKLPNKHDIPFDPHHPGPILRMYHDQSGRNLHDYYDGSYVVAMMITQQSGRNIFDMYKNIIINGKPDKSLVLNMLKYENELRLSKEFINDLENEALNTYESKKSNNNKPWESNVIENMQIKVVKKFGFKTDEEIVLGLNILRSAGYYYNNDNDIMNSVYYLKYNRAKKFQFNIGDYYKNITLYKLNKNKILLNELLSNEKPNIILSGSQS